MIGAKRGGVVVWIVVLLVVVVLVVGVFYFMSGGSEDKNVVRDSIYEEYVSACDGLEGEDFRECELASACVADGMVKYLTKDELEELKELVEDSGGFFEEEKILVEIFGRMDEERVMKTNEIIFPCMEKITEIVRENVNVELDEESVGPG